PKAFARTLEGAINAVNHQLQAKTAELAEKEDAEGGETQGGDVAAGAPGREGGAARPGGGRPGGQRAGGQRGTRKRTAASVAPHFVPMVNTSAAVIVDSGTTTSLDKQAYILRTPSDSPLKIVPPNFHPVIKLDGKYLVISVSADSADAALKAAKQKN